MENKFIVYISGPMTGVDNYYVNFKKTQIKLEQLGYKVINPAFHMDRLPNLSYEQYMKIDLALLDAADCICMLTGWENSRGANRELGYALGKNLTVIYEEELDVMDNE